MSIRPLSNDLQKKAIEELNEDPKRLKDDLDHIKTWLSQQHHIKSRTGDQWLVGFLRISKFSLERTKERIDYFHTMKTLSPEIYDDRDLMSPEMQRLLSFGYILPLKKVDDLIPRVIVVRAPPTELSPLLGHKLSTIITEILMIEDDGFIVSGAEVIIDMKNFGMGHVSGFQPALIKKMSSVFQKGYGSRVKTIRIVNPSTFFEVLNNLFLSIFSQKLKARIIVHSNLEDIYEIVPRSVLPEEYGGNAGKWEDLANEWKEKIEGYRDWLVEDLVYRTDESKRPGNRTTEEMLFGTSGSFRKLDVD